MLLVIGITGHTGRYFLEELKQNNYKEKIRFFIRKDSDKNLFKDCNLNYEIVLGNLDNENDLKEACEGVDTILEIYNIRYSLKVLNIAIEKKVRRVIFVHTTGIYSKYKMASEEYKKIEKEVIERAKDKIDITILRPTMIYGDICDHNISKFIKMIDKMRIYPMIAGGKARIQPVNARDLGKAYYKALIHEEETKNKDYNLSGDTEIAIKEMLKMISSKLGKKTIFITVPMWISLIAAYALKIFSFGKVNIVEKVLRMDESRVFDYNKAKEDFGYLPSSFKEGLELEISQYLERKDKKERKAIILTTVPSTIEQFSMNNIKLLQELGYKVDVASNFNVTGNIDKNRLESFTEELKKMNVGIYTIEFSRNPLNPSNIKAYSQARKILDQGRYSLIHCHTPVCGALTRLAAKKNRKKGTRVIYTAHGFHFYKGAPLLNWIIYYPLEKWLARYTDTLITINQEDYEMAKKHLKTKNIELVHGIGVEEEKFNFIITEEEKKLFREELGVKRNDFVMTIVGELNKNKNQIIAIEAMKELVQKNENIKLLLIGKGPLEEKYRYKIKEYNLEDKILMLGYRIDIPKILKISNLLLSLSYREGLPVNVIEAMMSGLPVVATNCRGNRELVRDGKNGCIIEPNNIEDLKNSILKYESKKENKEIIQKMTKYNLKVINEKVKEIYNGENQTFIKK